jgi:hypothetical protein|nr:hypothetical protein [Dyella sp. ASV24]
MHSNFAEAVAFSEDLSFAENGYAIVPNLVSREIMNIAWRYYLMYLRTPGDYYGMHEKVKALDRYADALGESLLVAIKPRIEAIVGKQLVPTYSLARIYTPESRLTKHVDRKACEISATVTVGYRNVASLWPIFVESRGQDVPITLDIGDAMIYRGMDLPHWREQLPEGAWCQLFFHFVDAHGELLCQTYDGRSSLGPVPRSSILEPARPESANMDEYQEN